MYCPIMLSFLLRYLASAEHLLSIWSIRQKSTQMIPGLQQCMVLTLREECWIKLDLISQNKAWSLYIILSLLVIRSFNARTKSEDLHIILSTWIPFSTFTVRHINKTVFSHKGIQGHTDCDWTFLLADASCRRYMELNIMLAEMRFILSNWKLYQSSRARITSLFIAWYQI